MLPDREEVATNALKVAKAGEGRQWTQRDSNEAESSRARPRTLMLASVKE